MTATTVIPATATRLARFRLTWLLTQRERAEMRYFSAAQGAFLALVRAADLDLAARLHDAPGPKPYALSPLVVTERGDCAVATLTAGCWDAPLAATLAGGLVDTPCTLAGIAATLLNCELLAEDTPASLIVAASADARTANTGRVPVAFVAPVCFSLGALPGGTHRYAVTPEPCYVVPAWWRRWRELGGATYDVPPEGGGAWLAERVVIHALRWETRTVRGPRTALTGGVGRVSFAWAGPERWGGTLLGALAQCATYTGTGAKTTQGFGETAVVSPGEERP